ncbi:MAG TPA: M15 family metallopeptidase [Micrococcaceae bacterium]|jgi:D-alanyl-D-alanine carboxypeptidase|nr:M15 family metallopeptidase [Micrococcaceae bacterium]
MTGLPRRRDVAKLLGGGSALALLAACSAPGQVSSLGSTTTAAGTSASPAGTAPVSQASAGAGSSAATESGSASESASAGPAADAAAAPAGSSVLVPAPVHALKQQFSITDPASPWVLVNKQTPLSPRTYAPADLVHPAVALGAAGEAALLRAEPAAAAARMFSAAAADGVVMTLLSSYRSYETQVALYNSYASSTGVADADTKSARPGFSEHQTGLAFDIGDGSGACSFNPCFATIPAAVWAAGNAQRFGFIVRYQLGRDAVTGYYAEPWHLRYVGVELATDLVAKGYTTFEEYLGLPPAPAYPKY